MKKNVLTLTTIIAIAFSANATNGEKNPLSSQFKKLITNPTLEYLAADPELFDCYFFVSVWDERGLYVSGKYYKNWVNNEEDCLEWANDEVVKTGAQQPANYSVKHDRT